MRRLSLLLVVGCSDAPFELRDGSRIELRYWTYADGTRQWDATTFFDAKLRADCRPLKWSDGHTYCTPESGSVAYADEHCDQPLGHVPAGAAPPVAFRRDHVFASEHLPSRMYVRRAERAPLARTWLWVNNVCAGPFDDAGARYFEVDEVPMVRMTTTAPRGDGRVRAAFVTTDDGLQAPSTLYDSLVDVACTPVTMADGSIECRPDGALDAAYFRDASCSERTFSLLDTNPVPAVTRIVGDDGCNAYHRVGREISKEPLFYKSGDRCIAIQLPLHERVFEVGEPVVAPLARELADGGARLQTTLLVDGSLHIPSPTLFDTTLGEFCERVTISAGATALCIPHAIPAVPRTYFLDSTCEGGFLSGMRAPPRACEPPAKYAVHATNNQLRILELGPPSTGPHYEVLDNACKLVDAGDIRVLGAEVHLDTFATAVRE